MEVSDQGDPNQQSLPRDAGILLIYGPAGTLPAAVFGVGSDVGKPQFWQGLANKPVTLDLDLVLLDVPSLSGLPAIQSPYQTWAGLPLGNVAASSPEGAGELLCNMMSVGRTNEDEFNAWYDTEHLPRLLTVPGVLSARRFRAVLGTPDYAAIYHLVEKGVVGSEPWRAASDTPWTRRIQGLRSNPFRVVFHPGVRCYNQSIDDIQVETT